MLRLTVVTESPEMAELKVEGWVVEGEVTLLAETGARLLAGSRRLVLQLAGVVTIDQAGVALLEQWAGADRLLLRGGSRYVRTLLARHGLRCEEGGDGTT